MIFFNVFGLLGAGLGIGVGMAGVAILQKTSGFAAVLWFVQSSVFVSWLFGLIYDRTTSAPNILAGYTDSMRAGFGSPCRYGGRVAFFGVPLICAPLALLGAFLLAWVAGILINATTKQNVLFGVITILQVAITAFVTVALDYMRRR